MSKPIRELNLEQGRPSVDQALGWLEAELEAGDYRQVLLDLRNNGGGSDGVLVPILMLVPGLVEEGVKVNDKTYDEIVKICQDLGIDPAEYLIEKAGPQA